MKRAKPISLKTKLTRMTASLRYYGVARTRARPLAERLLARDAAGAASFLCWYCRARTPSVEASIDHRTPRSRGGDNALENLALCCKRCNGAKGALMDQEYRSIMNAAKEVSTKEFDVAAYLRRILYFGANMFRRMGRARKKP